MIQKKLSAAIIFVGIFCAATTSANAGIKSIRYSSIGGKAAEEQELFITSTAITATTYDPVDQSNISRPKKMLISVNKWNEIISTINIGHFNSLPDAINCKTRPDYCPGGINNERSDGQQISIEISDGAKIKEILFSPDNIKVPELNSFINKMQEIELEMKSIK